MGSPDFDVIDVLLGLLVCSAGSLLILKALEMTDDIRDAPGLAGGGVAEDGLDVGDVGAVGDIVGGSWVKFCEKWPFSRGKI